MIPIGLLIASVCALALPIGGLTLLARWHAEVRRFANLLMASYVSCLLLISLAISGNYLSAGVFLTGANTSHKSGTSACGAI